MVATWRRYAIVVALFLIAFKVGAQTAQPPATAQQAADSLTQKILIAVVSGALSLLTGYVLLYLKERSEEHKRLSYDLSVRDVLGIDHAIAPHVVVTYKERPAAEITFVLCDVRNTGNRVVKDQRLRFDFGAGVQVLDAFLEPTPPRELGVVEQTVESDIAHERQFAIGHIEKGQQVNFRFVVAGRIADEVRLYPFNDAGDVEVLPGAITQAVDERKSLERFLVLLIMSLFVPPMFSRLPGFIGDTAAMFSYFVIALAIVPLIRPATRIIAASITAWARKADQPSLSIGKPFHDSSSDLNILVGNSPALTKTQLVSPGNAESPIVAADVPAITAPS